MHALQNKITFVYYDLKAWIPRIKSRPFSQNPKCNNLRTSAWVTGSSQLLFKVLLHFMLGFYIDWERYFPIPINDLYEYISTALSRKITPVNKAENNINKNRFVTFPEWIRPIEVRIFTERIAWRTTSAKEFSTTFSSQENKEKKSQSLGLPQWQAWRQPRCCPKLLLPGYFSLPGLSLAEPRAARLRWTHRFFVCHVWMKGKDLKLKIFRETGISSATSSEAV